MRFTAASDQSLQVTLGEGISHAVNAEVHRLAAAVERASRGHFTGLSPSRLLETQSTSPEEVLGVRHEFDLSYSVPTISLPR